MMVKEFGEQELRHALRKHESFCPKINVRERV